MKDLNSIAEKINQFTSEREDELAKFDLIIGVSRGGLIPATLIAEKLDKLLIAAYIDQENNVYLDKPGWVKGKKVLLVDDICRSGLTLSKIKNLVESARPELIKTYTLFCLTKSAFRPDFTTLIEGDLKLPWD